MKRVLIIALVLTGLLSCKSSTKRNDTGIAGEYKSGERTATITKQKGDIEVSVCFDEGSCPGPCLTGQLKRADPKRFSGWFYPGSKDSNSEKHLVVISFFKNELEVLLPQKNKNRFTAGCDPEGTYKK